MEQIDVSFFVSLLPKSYSDISILAFGKRGIVFRAKKDDVVVAIKMNRPQSNSSNTLLLEAKYLSDVNKLGIGPNLIEFNDNYVVMEFVDGLRIDKWIVDSTRDEICGMLSVLFHQLFILDKAGINKSEMTNPYKHVIIKKDLIPVLIDFERARFNLKPQNFTQFAQFLTSANVLPLLQEKNILLDVDKFKTAVLNYSKDRKEFDVLDFM